MPAVAEPKPPPRKPEVWLERPCDDWVGLLAQEQAPAKKARQIVEDGEFYTFDAVKRLSYDEFRHSKGIGPAIAGAVRRAFRERGWSFAADAGNGPAERAGLPVWMAMCGGRMPRDGPGLDALRGIGGSSVFRARTSFTERELKAKFLDMFDRPPRNPDAAE